MAERQEKSLPSQSESSNTDSRHFCNYKIKTTLFYITLNIFMNDFYYHKRIFLNQIYY